MPKRNIVDKAEIETFLQQQTIGRLGTFSEDYPYIVPLCYVYYQKSIYFHSGLRGKKIQSIRKNPRVCFQVDQVEKFRVDPSPCNFNITYRSVIVYGTVSEVTEIGAKMEALLLLTARFYGDIPQSLPYKQVESVKVFKIDVDYMTGKANHEA
ncbi:MAG: pyridoxamine 5'-phosphate oxidase family protein [Bacillota bacterium]